MTANTRRAALLALAERVEGAEEVDSHLDDAVVTLLGWRRSRGGFFNGWWAPPGSEEWQPHSPSYTASIDAAMMLVPMPKDAGKWWSLAIGCAGVAFARVRMYGEAAAYREYIGQAYIPALALTAAALRALAAEEVVE